jgi:predicted nucleotidyltransferase
LTEGNWTSCADTGRQNADNIPKKKETTTTFLMTGFMLFPSFACDEQGKQSEIYILVIIYYNTI